MPTTTSQPGSDADKLWSRTLRNEDLDFGKAARSAVLKNEVRGANFLLWGVVASIIAFVSWAGVASLDEVTKGAGKVIPSSAMQTVQNLEGGILAEIMVHEGQSVAEGDVLIRIDDTMTSASYREEASQRDSLEAMLARHHAEANQEERIEFPPQIVSNRPELLAREQALFDTRIGERDKQIVVISKSLELANEELSMTMPLVQKQIVSKVEQLRLEREVNELQGRLLELTDGFQREAMESYNETKSRLEALVSVLDARKDRVDRTLVRSPISGTVNKLHKTTLGGVIQPGEDIVDIVPRDGTLLVEARINPRDIAFLRPGQKAKVKLTAYDFSIYGGLDGVVEHISADTIQDEVDKQHYYHIKVRNEGGVLEKDGEELDIMPGMIAEVDVLTGRRTVLEYLSKPFHRMRLNSLTER